MLRKLIQRVFTRCSYPRNPGYKTISSNDIQFFQSFLQPHEIITDQQELKAYNTDFLKTFEGKSEIMLKPKTTKKISKILQYCNNENIAVCPQGGNTGLVFGSTPHHDELILSLSNLNKIEQFKPEDGVLIAEGGCVLELLNEHVQQSGYIVPLDLGAKGSCQIGGNVATNAGGNRLIRYGSLHGNVLGLEVILSDGSTLNLMNTLRKDNTGYDLKQLFIGSEGTLGVITKVAIQCAPKPQSQQVALLVCENFDTLIQLQFLAKQELQEIVSAIEYFDQTSLQTSLEFLKGLKNPFNEVYPYYALIETQGSNESHDSEKLENFLQKAMTQYEDIKDGLIAQNFQQRREFWRLREEIALSIVVPPGYLLRKRLPKTTRVLGWGHISDGNLHIAVMDSNGDNRVAIEPFIFEYTHKHKGSISAEHGIGRQKLDKLHFSKSQLAIDYMKSIKSIFDPKGILNPYKVIQI